MRHIPRPLQNCLITRSGLEPSYLRVDLCRKVRLGLEKRGGELGRGFWVCSTNNVRLVGVWFRGYLGGGLAVCTAVSD